MTLESTQPETPETNYTRRNVSVFLPGLLEITDNDPDFPWDGIDQLFKDTWTEKAAGAVNDSFQVEATFFFVFMAALKRLPVAVGYIDFLNRLFEELAGLLPQDKQKMICSTIKKLLKTPTLQFLNFLGELATLNNLLKSKTYELDLIESPLPNDNSIDFRLKNLNDSHFVFVEVLNIHVDDDRVESSPIAIEKFIAHRLKKKRREKNEDLENPDQFWLVPVLWAGWRSLEIYRDHFKIHQIKIPDAIEPLAYLQHSDRMGYYDHQFGRVSTLISKDGLPVLK